MSRHGMMLVALAALAVGTLPAAAQPACPTPPPGPPPRAGFTCAPLAGGGVTTETTCTLFGDTAWLTSQPGFSAPPGTCSFRVTFDNPDWAMCPFNLTLEDGVVGLYQPVGGEATGPPVWLPCSIPATGVNGLVALGALLLACGVLVLWRRAG